jgi:hypothetical protein
MKQWSVLIAPVILLAAIASTVNAADSTKIAIAVLDVKPLGSISQQESQLFSDRLRSELFNIGAYTVLERAMMTEILKEQAFQQTGACDDQSCIVQMGQLLSVRSMIGGSIGKVGTMYSISIKMIDVTTGAVTHQITRNVKCSKSDLVAFEARNCGREIAGLPRLKKPVWPIIVGITAPVVAAGGAIGLILYLTNGSSSGNNRVITVDGTFQ